MRGSRKERRSDRIPESARMLLTVHDTGGKEAVREIVTTLDISEHGARLRGRRTLQPDSTGTLLLLNSGRQTPCRVVWQVKSSSSDGYLETGVELLANFNFWGQTFTCSDMAPPDTAIFSEDVRTAPEEFLRELQAAWGSQSGQTQQVLEAAWCGLVEQLEEREIITRSELVAAIRKIQGS